MFPNSYSQTTEIAGNLFSSFLGTVKKCPRYDAIIWLCMALFPACPYSDGKPMCKEFCMGIENSCGSYFDGNVADLIDCSIYPDTDCVSFGGSK